DEVRRIAERLGLRTAHKPDSQDVCFITSVEERAGFLAGRTPSTPGPIVDTQGETVGTVDSVELGTTGKRLGRPPACGGAPRYVVDTDVAQARVTVGRRADLFTDVTRTGAMAWSDRPELGPAEVQTSAHGRAAGARVVEADDTGAVIAWDAPHQRVAPGQ